MWRFAAKRKATDIYMGFLHPKPAYAFVTHLAEFMAKVLLPVITTETTSRPLMQTLLVTAVGFLTFVRIYIWPPYLSAALNQVMTSLKFFTFVAMSCGVLTVVINGEEKLVQEVDSGLPIDEALNDQKNQSNLPIAVLAISALLTICYTVREISRLDHRTTPVHFYTLAGSTGSGKPCE
jgi:hypothetical protein